MTKRHNFEKLKTTIPNDLWLPLFKIFAKKHLRPASASFIEEATDKNLEKKVFKAIRNEIMLEAVEEILKLNSKP